MKPTFAAIVLATGAAMLALMGVVHAQQSPGGSGKTREQVREELRQAYRDGLLPHRRGEFPPSAETIRRNKRLYALRHPEEFAQRDTGASNAD